MSHSDRRRLRHRPFAAEILYSRGETLCLADLNTANLDTAVEDISKSNSTKSAKVSTTAVDASDSAAVNVWIDAIITEYERLDCAANIAGIRDPFRPLREKSDEEWDRVMNVNAKGVFYCMRKECNVMKEGPSIVNACSMAGLQGTPGIGCYAASKHAAAGLTKTAAGEEGPRGIRNNGAGVFRIALCYGSRLVSLLHCKSGCVSNTDIWTAVALGVIRTQMTACLHSADDKGGASGGDTELLQSFLVRNAIKRMEEPEEVSRVIAFLLNDDASFQTGTLVPVDGGYGC
ncbi:MAG: SDR family NAD(P)-dependent oxidoreductase [Janthinobacterium lividum]